MQRTIFSEVFYVMAMTSLYTLTSDVKYKVVWYSCPCHHPHHFRLRQVR